MRHARIARLATALSLLAACGRSQPADEGRTSAPAPASVSVALPVTASALPPGVAASAAPPTDPAIESLVVVASPRAPVLGEIGPGVNASVVLQAGDLVTVVSKRPPLSWHARMGGVEAKREGVVVEVRSYGNEAPHFTFESDLGETLAVPSAARICAKLADASTSADPGWPARCAGALRRARISGGRYAAYLTCGIGPCPVAIVKGDDVSVVRVDGVTTAELRSADAQPALLLTTRWVKDEGKRSGGALVYVALDGPAPKVGAPMRLDEVDARDAVRVEQRDVRVEIGDAEVRVVGERRTVARDTAKVSGATPIDERHPLPRAR